MHFSELVKQPYSFRSYQSIIPDRELIESCLEAARMAPSACKHQNLALEPALLVSLMKKE